MRILIAPDSLKESLSASSAAQIIADACHSLAQSRNIQLEIDALPMSDGGEGFLDALHTHFETEYFEHNVQNPLGAPVNARWAVLHDDTGWLATNPLLALGKALLGSLLVPDLLAGSSLDHRKIAAIEIAQAAGIHLVPAHRRNPAKTSSTGVGELILRALDRNASRLWIGLGGSATVDGGIGALHTLGARFLDKLGNAVPYNSNRPIAQDLLDIHDIDLSDLDPRLDDTRITLLCDVQNPLLGDASAAAIFAPQKGATPEQIPLLEQGLSNLADAFARLGKDTDPHAPFMGAAGGMSFGFAAALDATPLPGAQFLIDLLDIPQRIRDADLLITAEGCLDATSFQGKLVGSLASLAHEAGTPTLAIVGHMSPNARQDVARLNMQVRTLVDDTIDQQTALRDASTLLDSHTRAALESFLRAR